ncbi:MAG: hypothetical protein IPN54_09405 [Bacteroidetes bacterium]|nr:hypothetical protein [Bacteroidota bacterium]
MGTIEVKGEGSTQYKPDTTKTTYLMVLNNSNGYGTFAGYSATDTNRLFIRIRILRMNGFISELDNDLLAQPGILGLRIQMVTSFMDQHSCLHQYRFYKLSQAGYFRPNVFSAQGYTLLLLHQQQVLPVIIISNSIRVIQIRYPTIQKSALEYLISQLVILQQ